MRAFPSSSFCRLTTHFGRRDLRCKRPCRWTTAPGNFRVNTDSFKVDLTRGP